MRRKGGGEMRRGREYLLLVNAPHLFHVPSLWKKRNMQLRKVIIPLSVSRLKVHQWGLP